MKTFGVYVCLYVCVFFIKMIENYFTPKRVYWTWNQY